MNKNNKHFKSAVATNNTPSNEVATEVGAGAINNPEVLLQDAPATGAFQEENTAGETFQEVVNIPFKPADLVKSEMSIEERLSHVENLHRLMVQRENIIERMRTLEDFEIDLIDASDELESNHFTGCKLIIMANNGKQFVTNTSNLIVKVVDFVKEACANKKAELENNIQFPN